MTEKNSRRVVKLGALLAPLVLLLNGCQSPQSREPARQPAHEPAREPAHAPAATPPKTPPAPAAEPPPAQPAQLPDPTPAPEARPATGETMHPPEPKPTPPPRAPVPATKPASAPAETVVPPYIVRTIALDANKPIKLQAETRAPSTLTLDTRNLQRIRISRAGLPLARNRSVAIVIDNQGIEWTTRTDIIELERSPAGVWSVLKRE